MLSRLGRAVYKRIKSFIGEDDDRNVKDVLLCVVFIPAGIMLILDAFSWRFGRGFVISTLVAAVCLWLATYRLVLVGALTAFVAVRLVIGFSMSGNVDLLIGAIVTTSLTVFILWRMSIIEGRQGRR